MVSIDVTKITKERLYEGKKGKYLTIFLQRRDDDYGNHYMAVEGLTRDETEANKSRDKADKVRGNILGNGKKLEAFDNKPKQETTTTTTYTNDPDEDVPF